MIETYILLSITATLSALLIMRLKYHSIKQKAEIRGSTSQPTTDDYDDDFMCIMTKGGDTIVISGDTVIRGTRTKHIDA